MPYSLPNVKPWVVAAANELGSRFGIKSIGGYRNDTPFVYGSRDHPGGLALDLMTTTGDGLAAYAVANADRLGVNYVIWNRRIWSRGQASKGWRAYTGTSNPHTDHVHVSFLNTAPGPGTASGTSGPGVVPVGLPTPGDLVGAVRDAASALGNIAEGVTTAGKFAEQLTKLALPSNITRAVAGLFGIGFLFIGIRFLVKEVKH